MSPVVQIKAANTQTVPNTCVHWNGSLSKRYDSTTALTGVMPTNIPAVLAGTFVIP